MSPIKTLVVSSLAVALLFGVQGAYAQSGAVAHPTPAKEKSKSFAIPRPMEMEHEELHSNLAQLTKAGGQTGEAAKAVAAVLDSHLAKEERICPASPRPVDSVVARQVPMQHDRGLETYREAGGRYADHAFRT